MKNFVCDLDDCLIKTDLLLEQWLKAIKKNPLLIFASLLWAFKGKSYLKLRLVSVTSLDPKELPYREELIEKIKTWKKTNSGKVILASASPQEWVDRVANHLGLFDVALGTSVGLNLKGTNKLKAIQHHLQGQDFIYAGDSKADLKIWKHSSDIIAVNPSSLVQSQIQKFNKPTDMVFDRKKTAKALIKQLRPHQWVKNALIFLPAIAGHRIFDTPVIQTGLIAFVGFSASASFVYVLNDLLDLSADRNHRTKKNRPFASGSLSLLWGILLLPALLTVAFGTTLFLPLSYALVIVTYLVLNLLYSFYLKKMEILDIIILSSMYTLRIFAGSAATGILVSEWLLSFSTLFFFSLACVKRCTEISRSKNKITIDGRGYRQSDYAVVFALGIGAGLLSTLVILLYLQSNDVRSLYSNPTLLWLSTPVLLYWISLTWLRTGRDMIADDPVVYAIKDKTSWVCLAALMVILLAAS